jgi:hypothetical protein
LVSPEFNQELAAETRFAPAKNRTDHQDSKSGIRTAPILMNPALLSKYVIAERRGGWDYPCLWMK